MYWLTVSTAYLAAVLPYVWIRLFGYHMSMVNVHFALAAMWIIASCAAFVLAGKDRVRRWLPLPAGPFALWPAAVTAYTFLVWKLYGFGR
jgi:hypothetical protein